MIIIRWISQCKFIADTKMLYKKLFITLCGVQVKLIVLLS